MRVESAFSVCARVGGWLRVFWREFLRSSILRAVCPGCSLRRALCVVLVSATLSAWCALGAIRCGAYSTRGVPSMRLFYVNISGWKYFKRGLPSLRFAALLVWCTGAQFILHAVCPHGAHCRYFVFCFCAVTFWAPLTLIVICGSPLCSPCRSLRDLCFFTSVLHKVSRSATTSWLVSVLLSSASARWHLARWVRPW